MAHIKLSELIADIRGSIRNTVYSFYKGINTVRSNAEKVGNPKTSVQQDRCRNYLVFLSQYWTNFLSPEQRASWELFADPQEHGQDAFCRCNMLLRSISYPAPAYSILRDAPIGMIAPTAPSIINFWFKEENNSLVITYTKPADWGSERPGEEPGRVRLWLSGNNHVYRRIAITETGPESCQQVYEDETHREYNTEQPMCPGTYRMVLDAVNSYGLKSPSSQEFIVVIPQPEIDFCN